MVARRRFVTVRADKAGRAGRGESSRHKASSTLPEMGMVAQRVRSRLRSVNWGVQLPGSPWAVFGCVSLQQPLSAGQRGTASIMDH
jgi:hypothetical protein